jgi:hypothetical protein
MPPYTLSLFCYLRLSFPDIRDRLRNILVVARHKVKTLNLFKMDLIHVEHGIISTRVYLIVLALSMVVLIVYSSSLTIPQQIVISNPNADQSEEVQRLYRSSASCPCRQVSMLRSTFMSIDVRFHSFCSSAFVQDDGWLRYWPIRFLNGTIDRSLRFHPNDFRQKGFYFFKFMQLLCELAHSTIEADLDSFLGETFITLEPINQSDFSSIIESWQSSTITHVSLR